MGVIQPFSTVLDNHTSFKTKGPFSLDTDIFIEKEDAEKLANGDTVILKYAGACKVSFKSSDSLHLQFLGEDYNIS